MKLEITEFRYLAQDLNGHVSHMLMPHILMNAHGMAQIHSIFMSFK